MNLINLIEIILLVFLLLLVARFYLVNKPNTPQWEQAMKENKVPAVLKKALNSYPDKQRFFIFWLQVQRILKDNIQGDFAELGVYKGETARLLHLMAPQRKLHLFDTFEGFSNKDLLAETGEAATYTDSHFADTSIETVKHRIDGGKNIHFHPGRFPDSALVNDDVQFSLVSIDVDLYKPTKAGLEYFYRRLSPGGVIFVHDYNHKWPMLMKAVDDFAAGIPEVPVIFPDKDSTILITKSKSMTRNT